MHETVIFLGDSITDGGTLLLLIEAACVAAGRPVPQMLNAGAGGDSAAQAVGRMARDVLAYAPATVVMMTGVNDSYRGISPDETLGAHRAAAGICAGASCPLVVVTPTALRADLAQYAPHAALAARVADQARSMGLPLVDGHAAVAAVPTAWVPDGIHLSLDGYRALAAALLPAIGLADVAVPENLVPPVIPGLIREWTLTSPTGTQAVTLPQAPVPGDDFWVAQERARGFLISWPGALGEQYGISKGPVAAVATIAGGRSELWLGGQITSLHINGRIVALDRGWFGWHLGHHRVMIDLPAGDHRLEIGATGGFAVARRSA